MLEKIKKEVLQANQALQKNNLVVLTWGNVSGRDPKSGLIVIKASGVEYDKMEEKDLVVVDREGHIVEGNLRPSTDLDTHLELYKAFPDINGIVHTHSTFATIWSQAGIDIPCYGTTHADYYPGVIPVTRDMSPEEIQNDYEKNTGKVIVETFKGKCIDPNTMRAVLVKCHGPFVWGKNAQDAIHNAIVLENIAKMEMFNLLLNGTPLVTPELLKKHYDRKFGKDAYYGQE